MINCTHSDQTIFEGMVEGLIITYAYGPNHDNNFDIKNFCFHRKALQMR
jgi:hypothetical protein